MPALPPTLPDLAPLLAQITWTIRIMAIAFVVISVFMMLVILIQKPKGGGLSGAFGGAGGSDTSFVGAKVGDFLTILTVGCFLAFLLLGMGLTWAINPTENSAAAAQNATAGAGAGVGAGATAPPTTGNGAGSAAVEAGPASPDEAAAPVAAPAGAPTPPAPDDAAPLTPDATDATGTPAE